MAAFGGPGVSVPTDRGVWCSKGTPLMEAELFAATVFAPCTVWPRTVMRGG